MLESDALNYELEFFKVTNSIFFIKSSTSILPSFLSRISSNNSSTFHSNHSLSSSSSSSSSIQSPDSSLPGGGRRRRRRVDAEIRRRVSEFLSVSLSAKGADEGFSDQVLGRIGDRNSEDVGVSDDRIPETEKKEEVVVVKSSGALNTTKHLWAGAVEACA